jgi:hypothetical protein
VLKLDAGSLEWALNHALLLGDTDVFPRPFEYKAIKHSWTDICQQLLSVDALEWSVRPHRTLLAAKAKVGFRPVTQLDPLDFLVFASLVKDIGKDIEDRRIPVTKQTVYSYRYKPSKDGRLFDPSLGYSRFVIRAGEVLDERPELTHVVVTDIADFYPRIYHHRLENALSATTKKTNHVKALMRLLAGWNGKESYGIPIGSGPARLLAEATLIDVDEALLANQIPFVRFNDDYRLFATSYDEGYRDLALLAEVLHRNHGFTLQREKTHLLDAAEFQRRYLETATGKEAESLRDRFGVLVKELDLANPYEPIDYDTLDEQQKALIDSLNLSQLLDDELAAPQPEYAIVRFVIRRFAQLADDSIIETLLDNLDDLHPVFPDIIRYLLSLPHLPEERRHELGGQILDLLDESVVSELAWHRMWALELFANSTDWNQADRFMGLLGDSRDLFVRRKLILALGRAQQRHWFQSHWRDVFEESPWPRRALLAAGSCLPSDARKHWYNSVEDRLDLLELAVTKWARANPFAL